MNKQLARIAAFLALAPAAITATTATVCAQTAMPQSMPATPVASAMPDAPPKPAVPALASVLAAGTSVQVALDKTIQSNGTGDGDPVLMHVTQPVYSSDPSHAVFIASGAQAMGHIITAKKRGYIGRRGQLKFQIDYVVAVDGKRVYLTNAPIGGRAYDRGAISVTGFIVTGAGLFLLVQGSDRKYPAGTPFTVYVDQQATL